MIRKYTINSPGEVIFGVGTADELARLLEPYHTVMIVTGKSAVASGMLVRLECVLAGHELVVVCGVAAEPPLEEANRLIDAGRHHRVQAVVALGGGSVIDTAKTAACLIPADGRVEDYFDGKRQITRRGLYCVALPTTAGTGAEITPNAVFVDSRNRNKKSIRHPFLIPQASIIDPELTVPVPASVTAASGMDALTQAIEAYLSLGATNFSDALAEKAVSLICGSLENAVARPLNLAARTDMAEGSMLTALAFSQSGLGAVHGIGHPLGSILHLPHGYTCAVLLPHVLEWNLPTVEPKLCHLARLVGLATAAEFVDMIRQLRKRLKFPEDFKADGLAPEHFDFIVKNCRSGSMKNNPRPMNDDEVIAFLRQLC